VILVSMHDERLRGVKVTHSVGFIVLFSLSMLMVPGTWRLS
jgi:hypothetical protein